MGNYFIPTTENQMEISKRLESILEKNDVLKIDGYSKFLYDPRGLQSRKEDNELITKPIINDIEQFPKLLASGTDDHYKNHHSYEIAKALNSHAIKMSKIEKEFSNLKPSDKLFNGNQQSSKIANAINEYSIKHKNEGLPKSFFNSASSSGTVLTSTSTGAAISLPLTMSTINGNTYSWATLLKSMNWACVIYTIVWICSGLILVFFGYSSFFWLHKLGLSRGTTTSRNSNAVKQRGFLGKLSSIFIFSSASNENIRSSVDSSASAAQKRRKQKQKTSFLSGGIGGILIGFLFFSYLTAVITNSICIDEKHQSNLSSSSYFAIWLAPGLLGSLIGGHFFIIAKLMTGILGGTSLTIILTAIFGIETILVRAILLSIFCVFLTIPMLLPTSKFRFTQMIILNACTSIIGMVTFLNGVALVAPSVQPSSNWLDLWTILFMNSNQTESSRQTLQSAWHSSTFKGYIAGAVLGSVLGFIFEFIFHRNCGHDPESEWNQYLGNYTQHIESGISQPFPVGSSSTLYDDPKYNMKSTSAIPSPLDNSRAGMFEPAPNAWQKMVDFFDSDRSRPAHYGGLSGDGTFTEGNGGISEKIKKKRSSKNSNGPARFERLSKRDVDDDDFNSDSSDDEKERLNDDDDEDEDDDKTDVGSDGEERRRATKSAAVVQMMNYGGYSLPRPPLLTNALSSSSLATTTNESRLSGTTIAASSSSSSSNGKLHKPVNVYRDSINPVPSNNTNSNTTMAATPSLINAISRIQLAQQQARAWQEQHQNQGTPPYSIPNSPEIKSNDDEQQKLEKKSIIKKS